MTKIENAIAFAALAHRGQKDKAGAPYILHPLRVMLSLGPNASDDERYAAMLHDVIEDCGVRLEELRFEGFNETVIGAVDALTKRPDEKNDYMKAIRRVAQNPIARRVKIGDLTDNLDTTRLSQVTPEDEARNARYREALAFLTAI